MVQWAVKEPLLIHKPLNSEDEKPDHQPGNRYSYCSADYYPNYNKQFNGCSSLSKPAFVLCHCYVPFNFCQSWFSGMIQWTAILRRSRSLSACLIQFSASCRAPDLLLLFARLRRKSQENRSFGSLILASLSVFCCSRVFPIWFCSILGWFSASSALGFFLSASCFDSYIIKFYHLSPTGIEHFAM